MISGVVSSLFLAVICPSLYPSSAFISDVSVKRCFLVMCVCRYCDFVVHEVAADGGVVKLTNYSLPIEVNEVSLLYGLNT